jgi:predicted Zn-dependent protease with MMP-like domain
MIPPDEFDALVEEALRSLPREFADLLENVAIVVEEEPSDEDLDETCDHDHGEDDDDDHELLGIYRVIPPLPDQVAIFRGPILRIARNRKDAVREIRDTVVHELGHYFGLEDDGMIY